MLILRFNRSEVCDEVSIFSITLIFFKSENDGLSNDIGVSYMMSLGFMTSLITNLD